MLPKPLLIAIAGLSCSICVVARAQVEDTPLGSFMQAQGLIAIPTAWQPYVGPGSFIFVGWDNHIIPQRKMELIGHHTLQLTGKVVNYPEQDVPQAQAGSATAPGEQQLKQGGLDISGVLGNFSPELQIGKGSRIDYKQTKFGFKGYDANQASAAFHQSALTQRDVLGDLYSTRDKNGQPVFLHYGKGYFITAIYTVDQLHIITTTTTQVSAALQALTAGTCLPDAPQSQFGKNDHDTQQTPTGAGAATQQTPTGAGAATQQTSKDAAKGVTGAANPSSGNSTLEPKTVLQTSGNDASAPRFQVKVCKKTDTEYDLSTSPGIPIGIRVIEVNFSGMQPRLDVTGPIQYFRKAMKYPD